MVGLREGSRTCETKFWVGGKIVTGLGVRAPASLIALENNMKKCMLERTAYTELGVVRGHLFTFLAA